MTYRHYIKDRPHWDTTLRTDLTGTLHQGQTSLGHYIKDRPHCDTTSRTYLTGTLHPGQTSLGHYIKDRPHRHLIKYYLTSPATYRLVLKPLLHQELTRLTKKTHCPIE